MLPVLINHNRNYLSSSNMGVDAILPSLLSGTTRTVHDRAPHTNVRLKGSIGTYLSIGLVVKDEPATTFPESLPRNPSCKSTEMIQCRTAQYSYSTIHLYVSAVPWLVGARAAAECKRREFMSESPSPRHVDRVRIGKIPCYVIGFCEKRRWGMFNSARSCNRSHERTVDRLRAEDPFCIPSHSTGKWTRSAPRDALFSGTEIQVTT